jgi:putative acetyltransferase
MLDSALSDLTLRVEAPADYRAVEELTREAFWNVHVPGCDEHYLVHLMREHSDFLPELSFVAELQGRIVGNIMTTRSLLKSDSRDLKGLTVGPVSVHPDFQRKGIGRALLARVAEDGRKRGEAAIVLFGHPHDYVGAGYRNAKDLGIATSDGSHPLSLLALELLPGALAGTSWRIHFGSVFEIPSGFFEFDKTFLQREVGWRPSQELFAMTKRARLT